MKVKNVTGGAAVGIVGVGIGIALFPGPAVTAGLLKVVGSVAIGALAGAGVGLMKSGEKSQAEVKDAAVKALNSLPSTPKDAASVVAPLVEVPLNQIAATMATSAARVTRVAALTIITVAAGYLSQQPTCLATEYLMPQYMMCYSACAAVPVCSLLAIREAVRK
jgi:hypothetical protein